MNVEDARAKRKAAGERPLVAWGAAIVPNTLEAFGVDVPDAWWWTTKDRQGDETGAYVRSEIFSTSDEQCRTAEETIADVDASGLWPGNAELCHFLRPGWKLPHRQTAA